MPEVPGHDRARHVRILFLHGWTSVPGGRKPTYLTDHGHEVINPALPDDDFDESVQIAEAKYNEHQPDVIVGSSRGGAVAINMASGSTPLILLCPAWKNWGNTTTVKPKTIILHSRQDDVIPFTDSKELVLNSNLSPDAFIEVGNDHRLADPRSSEAMLKACEQMTGGANMEIVEVTVYYLEMLTHSRRNVPAPLDHLTVLHARTPSVPYYRFLYDAVGRDYQWLSRRKLSDEDLAIILSNPRNEVHVLHVDGSPAGFAELNCQDETDIELVQFGLIGDFIGQGLGKWFLQWTIDKVWGRSPKRFWLHICTMDHPAAVPNYTKAGFMQYKEENIQRHI